MRIENESVNLDKGATEAALVQSICIQAFLNVSANGKDQTTTMKKLEK